MYTHSPNVVFSSDDFGEPMIQGFEMAGSLGRFQARRLEKFVSFRRVSIIPD